MSASVNRDGRIEEASVTESSGYALLDDAAAAVRGWRLQRDGQGEELAACVVEIPIRFQLN